MQINLPKRTTLSRKTYSRKNYRIWETVAAILVIAFIIWTRNFALLCFAGYHRPNLVRIWLYLGADPNCSDFEQSHSPLVFGCEDPNIVQILHQHGANLNLQLDSGHTALMEVVRIENEEGVRNLLAEGADINVRDYKGRDMLWYIDHNHEDNWPPSTRDPQVEQRIMKMIKRYQRAQ